MFRVVYLLLTIFLCNGSSLASLLFGLLYMTVCRVEWRERSRRLGCLNCVPTGCLSNHHELRSSPTVHPLCDVVALLCISLCSLLQGRHIAVRTVLLLTRHHALFVSVRAPVLNLLPSIGLGRLNASA